MGNTFYFSWEVELIEFLQTNLHIGTLIPKIFTFLGNEATMIIFFGFMYWCWDKEFAKRIGPGILIGVIMLPMLKNVVLRRRPYMDNKSIKCIVPAYDGNIYDTSVQGFSFPSMHASNSVISFGTLTFYKKKAWLMFIGIAIPIFVGASRFFLGVHYPTDVLAGWLIGIIAIELGNLMYRKISKKWIIYALIIAMSIPGWFFCSSEDFYTSFGIVVGISAGFLFEESKVRFANTRNPLRVILRPIFGLIIFLALNTVLKLPFSDEFLASTGFLSHLVRALRYAISSFVIIGLYPMLFALTDKLKSKA